MSIPAWGPGPKTDLTDLTNRTEWATDTPTARGRARGEQAERTPAAARLGHASARLPCSGQRGWTRGWVRMEEPRGPARQDRSPEPKVGRSDPQAAQGIGGVATWRYPAGYPVHAKIWSNEPPTMREQERNAGLHQEQRQATGRHDQVASPLAATRRPVRQGPHREAVPQQAGRGALDQHHGHGLAPRDIHRPAERASSRSPALSRSTATPGAGSPPRPESAQ